MKTKKKETATKWDEMYGKLVEFNSKYGHCVVGQHDTEFPGLGYWVATQRKRRKGSTSTPLSSRELKKLEALDFVWHVNHSDRNWNGKFMRLERYKLEHGDCLVPANYSENQQLASWVEKQRILYKEGKLISDRTKRLKSIGFSWTGGEAEARKVSPSPPADKKRAPKKRVSQPPSSARPKKKQKRTKLSPSEYLQRRVQQQWNESFDRLVKFKRMHGHWRVPQDWNEDTSLANWVQTQRNNRRSLDPDQVKRLDSIEFPWSVDELANEASGAPTGNAKYPVGTKVKMFVQGSGWLRGKVSRADDTHYRVRYDTGCTGDYSEDELQQIVLSPELAKVKVGSRISVQWPEDGKFYEGIITQESNEKRKNYLLWYDTGHYEWLDLFQSVFRLVEAKPRRNGLAMEDQHQQALEQQGSVGGKYNVGTKVKKCQRALGQQGSVSGGRYDIGTKVKKFFPGHGWFVGKITSFNGTFYTVLYSDGDSEEYYEQNLAEIVLSPKLAAIDIDTEISLQWPSNNNYYKATVILERNNKEDNFCVLYENGDYEWVDLRERKFRLIGKGTRIMDGEKSCIEIGSRIAVQWADGIFYGATVTRKKGGIYSLKYDDGDKEKTDLVERDYRSLRQKK